VTGESVLLGPHKVAVWPEGQRLEAKCGGKAVMTRFADWELYHPGLTRRILAHETEQKDALRFFKAAGSSKIYHLERWGLPEADLVHARALELFRRVLKCREAVADLSWANVYRNGDYSMAHSHVRSTASIVYALATGDIDPDDPMNGQLCLIDPRLEACCKEQKGHMTTPFLPKMEPGTMIIFPSQVVHCVNPYFGEALRITIAWNVNREPIPGSPIPETALSDPSPDS
jgi:hypothetical protein